MNDPQQDLILKLKEANNILVTVSANPSVDQLAAAIGLTILLNKLKKHATAVFSGRVPSTIDFLQPEDTLEKNTDSLRDFIIALDKGKADKLRYKVEENIVKIFITPYKTSINQNDLEFSQGDFNVDVVLALGVHEQQDLDQAITAHGRILHDAVVMSVNTQVGTDLGSINWTLPAASSLSELAVEIADALGKDMIDGQIATALLTGIVAETDRFSNEKTSPETMRLSAELMAAGANQQLVANKLEEAEQQLTAPRQAAVSAPEEEPAAVKTDDGTLEINHASDEEESQHDALGDNAPNQVESNPDEPPQPPEPAPSAPEAAESTPEDPEDEPAEKDDDANRSVPVLPPSHRGPQRHILEAPVLPGSTPHWSDDDNEYTADYGEMPKHESELPLLERNHPAEPEPEPQHPFEGFVAPTSKTVMPPDDTAQSAPEPKLEEQANPYPKVDNNQNASIPVAVDEPEQPEIALPTPISEPFVPGAISDMPPFELDALPAQSLPPIPQPASSPVAEEMPPFGIGTITPPPTSQAPSPYAGPVAPSSAVPPTVPQFDQNQPVSPYPQQQPLSASNNANNPVLLPPAPAVSPSAVSMPAPQPTTPSWVPPTPTSKTDTLSDIEQAVHSSHATSNVDDARTAVLNAINSVPAADQPLPPKEATGAQGYLNVHDLPDAAEPTAAAQSQSASGSAVQPIAPSPMVSAAPGPVPAPSLVNQAQGTVPNNAPLILPPLPPPNPPQTIPTTPTPQPTGPAAPPPVPPPMTDFPPFANPNS